MFVEGDGFLPYRSFARMCFYVHIEKYRALTHRSFDTQTKAFTQKTFSHPFHSSWCRQNSFYTTPGDACGDEALLALFLACLRLSRHSLMVGWCVGVWGASRVGWRFSSVDAVITRSAGWYQYFDPRMSLGKACAKL